MCRYLLSQTYTPKPDTTQRNSTECCIATGSHVHAGKALTISENIPNSDDICSQNTGQLNNRRVKNFLEAFSWKRRWIILLLWKVTQSHYQYYFCVEFLDGGKWKKHFPVLFSGNMAQLMNLWGYWYFLSNKRGRVSRHPRYGKAEVITLGNLYVNKHATCDFKISSPVTVSLLWTVR